MSFDWQNLTVLLATSAAGAYLARVAWQSVARKKASACGGCGNCPDHAGGPQVVGVEDLSRSANAMAQPASAPSNPGR